MRAALRLTAVLRVFPLLLQLWLVTSVINQPMWVITTTCAEHFFGGALTTAMFATMMASVDRRIGGSHFTLLAAAEVLGKTPAFWASGIIAQAFGFQLVFVAAVAGSLAFLPLLWLAKPVATMPAEPASG